MQPEAVLPGSLEGWRRGSSGSTVESQRLAELAETPDDTATPDGTPGLKPGKYGECTPVR